MYTNANMLNMKSRKMLYHDHVKGDLTLNKASDYNKKWAYYTIYSQYQTWNSNESYITNTKLETLDITINMMGT